MRNFRLPPRHKLYLPSTGILSSVVVIQYRRFGTISPMFKGQEEKDCRETLVRKYHSMLCNILEEGRPLCFSTLKIKAATCFVTFRSICQLCHLRIFTTHNFSQSVRWIVLINGVIKVEQNPF